MKHSIFFLAIVQLTKSSPPFLVDPSCPDYDLSLVCSDKCNEEYLECVTACSSSDCLLECSRAIATCTDSCPCHIDCIDGCVGCNNPVCFCNDTKNDNNLDACMTTTSRTLGECILDCKDDTSCETACVSSFKNDYTECPCQENCSLGCPCDNYECDLPDKKAILTLYSRALKPSVLIQPNGGVTENFEFQMDDDTEVYRSCSATLNGEHFVFGGFTQSKQVSKVIDCGLRRIGNLSYDFRFGTCGTYHFPEERIFLCFSLNSAQKCESFDGYTYRSHEDSKIGHVYTTLANTNGSPLAVSGYDGYSSYHRKAETFDVTANTWTEVADYPYSDFIYRYATVTTSQGALIIGGFSIAWVSCYNSSGWSRLDDLYSSRYYHRAIINGDKVYIIGGSGEKLTEIWSNDGDSQYIQLAEPELKDYKEYPELMLVDTKYCVKS